MDRYDKEQEPSIKVNDTYGEVINNINENEVKARNAIQETSAAIGVNEYGVSSDDIGIVGNSYVSGIQAAPKKKAEIGRFLVASAGGLAIYGLSSKISDNGALGFLCGAIACYALYKNMDSIADFTIRHLPDGMAKNVVKKFSDSFYENQVKNVMAMNNERYQNHVYYDKSADLAKNQKDAIFRAMSTAVGGASNETSVNTVMAESAKESHDDQVFIAIAIGGDRCTNYARNAVKVSLDGVEKSWEYGTDNISPDERNANMRSYYVTLLKGIESYGKSGYASVSNNMSTDDQLNNMGVRMVNRATVSEIMQSLKDMDEQYSFMDEATWNEIRALDIKGVDMNNIRNYDNNYMAQGAAEDKAARSGIVAKFKAERTGMLDASNQANADSINEKQTRTGNELSDVVSETNSEQIVQDADLVLA